MDGWMDGWMDRSMIDRERERGDRETLRQGDREVERERERDKKKRERERERLGASTTDPSVGSLCHPCITTTHLPCTEDGNADSVVWRLSVPATVVVWRQCALGNHHQSRQIGKLLQVHVPFPVPKHESTDLQINFTIHAHIHINISIRIHMLLHIRIHVYICMYVNVYMFELQLQSNWLKTTVVLQKHFCQRCARNTVQR